MFYRPLWIMLLFIYRVFFKRFYTSGFDNIEIDKPIIFIGNHVNAFLDPLMLPTQFWKKIYFIVRGDIFNTPFKRWMLWHTNQMPMFRERDGRNSVHKNEATYQKSYDLLKKNSWILIFSEGDCVQEKHLRPIKKGTARMAFGAVEKHGWELDVHLVPTTENYTHPAEFRTEVMMNIGTPIQLYDYKELYEEDKAKATNKLTKDIEAAMKAAYIHIENRADLHLFEQLIEIERNNKPENFLPWRIKNSLRFNREQKVANDINKLRIESEENLEELKSTANKYYDAMAALNLTDNFFSIYKPNVFVGFLLIIACFPIYLIGYVLNIGQYKFADYFAMNKIKMIHFKNSIRLGIILSLNLIIFFILIIIVSFDSLIWAASIPFIATILAWFTINYKEQTIKFFNYLKYQSIRKKNLEEIKELKSLRNELIEFGKK